MPQLLLVAVPWKLK
jgi:hypothetical protein